MSLNAGADLLLLNCGYDLTYQVHAAVVDGVRRGEIPPGRLNEALHRVLQAKERFEISERQPSRDRVVKAK
jgi:beta-glucosidase-like glycosyl hydrolase